MQDNLGNLLFDVSGTMRLAGTGTLASIFGDAALSVPIPNPMTNHPSFGSFKCYLGPGSYDFYMAKAGYTFETLTGVQGWGSLALQDASNVAITGGNAVLQTLLVNAVTPRLSLRADGGVHVPNYTPDTNNPAAFFGEVIAGANRYNCFMNGTAANYFGGPMLLGRTTEVAGVPARQLVSYLHASTHGLMIAPGDADTGGAFAVVLLNLAGTTVGTIACTGSGTAYNTTSDARLKKDVDDLTGELALIQALRPVRFRWNADDSEGVGFLAQEVAALVAGVITGEADAVDEAGTIVPMQIDYAKLVPWLVGAVKTLAAQVTALDARVHVLEDALGV
jgi:hypothetical protein